MSDFPKGTKGFCLKCGDHLLTFSVDRVSGDRADASIFSIDEGQGPWWPMEKCICRKCGEEFDFDKLIKWERPQSCLKS